MGFTTPTNSAGRTETADGQVGGSVSEGKAGVSKSENSKFKSAAGGKTRVWLCLAVLSLAFDHAVADEPSAAAAAEKQNTPQINVRSGATGRFVFGRWGAVTATVANPGSDRKSVV